MESDGDPYEKEVLGYKKIHGIINFKSDFDKLIELGGPNFIIFLENNKHVSLIVPALMFKKISEQKMDEKYDNLKHIKVFKLGLEKSNTSLLIELAKFTRNKLNLVFGFTPKGDQCADLIPLYENQSALNLLNFKLEELNIAMDILSESVLGNPEGKMSKEASSQPPVDLFKVSSKLLELGSFNNKQYVSGLSTKVNSLKVSSDNKLYFSLIKSNHYSLSGTRSFNYFIIDKLRFKLFSECLNKLALNVRNFTSTRIEVRKIANIIESNGLSYVRSEQAKDISRGVHHRIDSPEVFIACFIKELYLSGILKNWLFRLNLPEVFYQSSYLESLGSVNINFDKLAPSKLLASMEEPINQVIEDTLYYKVLAAFKATDIIKTKKLSKLKNFVRDMANKLSYTNLNIPAKDMKPNKELLVERLLDRIVKLNIIKLGESETVTWDNNTIDLNVSLMSGKIL